MSTPHTGRPCYPPLAPEELLQAGVAEAVAAGRNLHGLAHGLPTQRAQQPPLGLLQELVVVAGHGGRARASGAGHAAAPQPAPRSGRPCSGSGRRRLLPAACAQPARRKRGRGEPCGPSALPSRFPSHPNWRLQGRHATRLASSPKQVLYFPLGKRGRGPLLPRGGGP